MIIVQLSWGENYKSQWNHELELNANCLLVCEEIDWIVRPFKAATGFFNSSKRHIKVPKKPAIDPHSTHLKMRFILIVLSINIHAENKCIWSIYPENSVYFFILILIRIQYGFYLCEIFASWEFTMLGCNSNRLKILDSIGWEGNSFLLSW